MAEQESIQLADATAGQRRAAVVTVGQTPRPGGSTVHATASSVPADTSAALLSIIIPALNEAPGLAPTLKAAAAGDHVEIIVVDGGSDDDTVEIARCHGAVTLSSPRGRAVQMNRGAAAATGDILLFLHADTLLPPGFEKQVRALLACEDVVAGAFRLRIDAPSLAFRLIERLADWRSRWLHLPYGDQALFASAAVFHKVGGFAELPVMEDFALVRRLRREGRIVVAPSSVSTSARRWQAEGIWSTTWRNQGYVAAYLMGVPAGRIAAWRNARRH